MQQTDIINHFTSHICTRDVIIFHLMLLLLCNIIMIKMYMLLRRICNTDNIRIRNYILHNNVTTFQMTTKMNLTLVK